MDELGGVLEQDLGDFVFESDASSLQRILNNRALSPSSLGYAKPAANIRPSPTFIPSLTPAKNIPPSMKKQKELYEFFEAKNGAVFCRKRCKDTRTEDGITQKTRNFGREKLKGVMPVRMANATAPGKFGKTPNKGTYEDTAQGNMKHGNNNNYKSNIKPNELCKSEKRIVPFPLPLPRQSISERKAVPHLDKVGSLIPRPLTFSQKSSGKFARKELDFNAGFQSVEGLVNPKGDDSFEFAKPLDVGNRELSNNAAKSRDTASLAKMIMMRESLVGLPRESIGGLFRQSLSLAELDRLFEDDSTQSFEHLENRLKTPKRKGLRKDNGSNEKCNKPSENIPQSPRPTSPYLNPSLKSDNALENKGEEKSISTDSKTGEQIEPCKQMDAEENLKKNTSNDNENISNEMHSLITEETLDPITNESLVEIYEIEYTDKDHFDIQNESIDINAMLQKTLSLNDLASAVSDVETEKGADEQMDVIGIKRSISEENLAVTMSPLPSRLAESESSDSIGCLEKLTDEKDWLQQAEEDLEMYRKEQVDFIY